MVLDTAPIGMVTDTQLIARVADLSVYICRAGYTHKSHYELINELKKDHKLPNLCTLINCIDMDQRKTAITTVMENTGNMENTVMERNTAMATVMAMEIKTTNKVKL